MSVKRIDIAAIKTEMDSGVLVLTPNNRINTAIIDENSRHQNNKTWRAPRVKPIDIWIKSLWQELANRAIEPCCSRSILNSNEEFLLWSQVVEHSLKRYPLLNPDESASQLSHAYQDLSQYCHSAEQTELMQYQNISDVAIYTSWQTQFRDLCLNKGLIPLSDAVREIKDMLGEIIERREPREIKDLIPQQILLVNFFQPPTLYQQLFEGLELISSCKSIKLINQSPPCHFQTRVFPSPQLETKNCADWVKNICLKDNSLHIGIISTANDEQHKLLEKYLAQGNDKHSPIELSGVTHLCNKLQGHKSSFDSGVIKTAFQILNLNRDQQDSAEFCRLLQSPFLFHGDEQDGCELPRRIEMELFMRKNLSATNSLSKLIELMNRQEKPYHCPVLAQALLNNKSLYRRQESVQTAKKWCQLFSLQLDNIGWPGAKLSPADSEAIGAFSELLDSFSSSSYMLGKIDLSSALRKLKSLSLRASASPPFRRDCQVSLLSPTEAIGLSFDHLWLLNVNDQKWPGEARSSPFLPHFLQRELGIPGANSAIQHENARVQLEILNCSTNGESIASYHRMAEDTLYRPSSLIQDFPICIEPSDTTLPIAHFPRESLSTVNIEDSALIPLRREEKISGGHSIITDQSNCPFRAFANHRLKSVNLEPFQHGLSAKARGIAVHKSLEHLYNSIDESEALAALSEDERGDLISDSAAVAVKYLSDHFPEILSPRYAAIEQQRLEELLQKFLGKDLERPQFTAVDWEKEIHWNASQADCSTQNPLQLRLLIDRIDRLSDGTFALIDYKTGKKSYSSKDFLQDRPDDMQLQLYYAAASKEQTISTLAIAHLNVEKIGYSGIGRGEKFFPDTRAYKRNKYEESQWAELTSQWIEKVEQLAQDFSQGLSSVDPVKAPATCNYCKLKPLCRIRQSHGEYELEEAAP